VLGIVHAALAPVIVIAGAKPNLVLVGVVLVTALTGFLPGITWAFVAGLTANLLVGDPLGSVPLSMLIVAAMVAGGSRLFGAAAWVYPIAAVFAGSVVADLSGLVVSGLVLETELAAPPWDLILRAATLNAGVAALLIVPARLLARRYVVDEATAW
jgi:rod shape-determining protein MreD